jgi:restriction system protein
MARYYYSQKLINGHTGQQILITASDRYGLANKIQRQNERWERERVRNLKAEKKELAAEKTNEAQKNLSDAENILRTTLLHDDKIDWNSLLDRRPFPTVEPIAENYTKGSLSKTLSFIGTFKKKAMKQSESEKAEFDAAHNQYLIEKKEWESAQKEHNSSLAHKKIEYEAGENDGVNNYIDMVLDRSQYPDFIVLNHELIYESKTKTTVVDLTLPTQEMIPKISAFKYIASTDSIDVKQVTKKYYEALYNSVQYQIVLRTIHEIFESDYKQHIDSVVINGIAQVKNKGTGQLADKPIMTIQVIREDFLSVDLEHVEPYACFRHFKGVTAGSLIELQPVRPILKLDRNDKRIIQADNVLEQFDPTQNLASMPWEQFEVLVRDVIKKEFSSDTATVEVTQASRDAGVDAIAFDEDPIRGGKFVIQAKRYNNLVPVSAVRDLYGTVMNEGANRGILVTTSYYGPDAVSFSKDKPLTLINGEGLLGLFHKHGYDFKIELTKKRASSSRLI